MENEIILRHDTHLTSQTLDGNLRQIVAVHQNFSLFNVIKTADQIDDRCFSCSGRTDQCDRLTRLYRKADIGKHLCLRRCSFVVSKIHMGKLDASLNIRQLCHIFCIHDVCIGV